METDEVFKFEGKFRDAVNGVLHKHKRKKQSNYTLSMSNITPKKATNNTDVVNSLKGINNLGISKTIASAEMYSL